MACLPPLGRTVLIEVKTGNARRTPEQRAQQERFAAVGGICLVVRALPDFIQRLSEEMTIARIGPGWHL
jgi:hypothetical protein